MRPSFEVSDVLRAQRDGIAVSQHLNSWQRRTLDALARCRTASLGGHVDACTWCGTVRISYNSCRNRHCPKCQCVARERWIDAREADLLPVSYFHVVFTLPDTLNGLCMSYPRELYDLLFAKEWVIYAKRPFAGPEQVIEYLGRYTHKIAISNHRLVKVDKDQVSFTWKDYRHGARRSVMTLGAMEFIRRFALHILPKRFVRIRHYGILSSTAKRGKLAAIKESFGLSGERRVQKDWKEVSAAVLGWTPDQCPHCKQMTMVRVLDFDHRGPPARYASCLTPKTATPDAHPQSA